jgi:hypothetical protein
MCGEGEEVRNGEKQKETYTGLSQVGQVDFSWTPKIRRDS